MRFYSICATSFFAAVASNPTEVPLSSWSANTAVTTIPTETPFPSWSNNSFTWSNETNTCLIECKTDYDCPNTCIKTSMYDTIGTCAFNPNPPTPPPVTFPNTTKPCNCTDPSNIPSKCEVDILIDLLEAFVLIDHALLPQWTRAAFHDAGTFNQVSGVGGANGCLLNHPPMRLEPENNFMDNPLNTLMDIKIAWHMHPKTCINVSSADILQFAIFFATTRQKHIPETLLSGSITANAKRVTLLDDFFWGRPDENQCDIAWTENLPGFTTPASGGPIPARCTAAGGEIKEKMMDRNGFSAEEATVLIGAHTIGLIRHTFGASHAGPWVPNGKDNATPFGAVFDNTYHDFLINKITENDTFSFDVNVHPFTDPSGIFPSWFRIMPPGGGLDHLDTDIVLAFPSLNTSVHPDFHLHSIDFANSDEHFLKMFFVALQKMSKLGVKVELFPASHCEPTDCTGVPETSDPDGHFLGGSTVHEILHLLKNFGNSTAFANQATRKIQAGRFDEIIKLTTPVEREFRPETAKPTIRMPTDKPSRSTAPTFKPSPAPDTSSAPTTPRPTPLPPTTRPTQAQTSKPTQSPTTPKPTVMPTTSSRPSPVPTLKPTSSPTANPTPVPSTPKPSTVPTEKPSIVSSTKPPVVVIRPTTTAKPTSKPTVKQVLTKTDQLQG